MRRKLVLSSAALALAAAGQRVVGRADAASAMNGAGQAGYTAEQPATRDLPRLQALVHSATLAPSSHNTQCWQFTLQDGQIRLSPDFSRRCPVVDPDDHHLFVSMGCAAENLAQAAMAQGLHTDAQFDPEAGTLALRLEATRAIESPLFRAIGLRQCTRADYDGQALSASELRLLREAGTGQGVRVILLTGRTEMERVLDYVVAANTLQMGDPLFIAELKKWIRFSEREATTTGDGLFTGASGNPVVPRWLGSRLMDAFYTAPSENSRYARQVRSSAGLAVFVSERSDRAHWLEVGRCYERFALQATALEIRNAFLNQAVEVASVRTQFAEALALVTQRPDLVLRFGRGPRMPMSRRRPLQAVLRA